MFLTIDDIRRWKDEILTIDATIQDLGRKKEAIFKRLEAAALFVPPDAMARVFGEGKTEPIDSEDHGEAGTLTWTQGILNVLTDANRGMTREEVKQGLMKTSLSTKAASIEKSFYSAVDKLKNRGLLVKHGFKIYTPESYKVFRDALDVGIVEDDSRSEGSPVYRKSPFTEAMLAFVLSRPMGTTGGEIKDHLHGFPQFRTAIDRNSTHVYNVMSKLVKRGNIRKVGKIYYPPSLNAEAVEQDSGQVPSTASGGSIFE